MPDSTKYRILVCMQRIRRQYVCEKCMHVHPRFWGWCQNCGARGALQEYCDEPTVITEENDIVCERILSGCTEFDRVCGGGVVSGSVLLLSGEPGIGKSTLVAQLCSHIAQQGRKSLYFSGEESASQIKLRCARLGLHEFRIFSTGLLESIVATIEKEKPAFVVVDSVQTLRDKEGLCTMEQMRVFVMTLVQCAKKCNCPLVLIGHVTKSGSIAGPKLLEHMVDVVLSFDSEGDGLRILRSTKNRFGSTEEIGIFSMSDNGLEIVEDASARLCSFRNVPTVGSVVFPSKEGTRYVLVEVQALVAHSYMQMPRRSVVGWDSNRLAMVLAVLENHAKISFSSKDVYLNIVGGVRIVDVVSMDLAVAVALWSSITNYPIPPNVAACGEITLAGDVRQALNLSDRKKLCDKYKITRLLSAEEISVVQELGDKIKKHREQS